jgi:hypothetical protein
MGGGGFWQQECLLPPRPPGHTGLTCCFADGPEVQVSEDEIKRAQRADREAEKMKGYMRSRFDFLDME